MAYEELAATRDTTIERAFIVKVYGWMTLALCVTAAVALLVVSSPDMVRAIFGTRYVFIGLLLGELALVWILSASIQSLSPTVATGLFVLYSAVNGLTFAVIFLVYTAGSIASTFFITAGMFGAMALYGQLTRRNLTGVGSFMLMGLVGIIIASIANWFLNSPKLYWAITYIGVFIFLGLTAYDAQKIKVMSQAAAGQDDALIQKGAIMGALALYLDFINLFLLLLRLFGRRR